MPPPVKIEDIVPKEQAAPISEDQNEQIAEAALNELALEQETPEAKKKREDAEAVETKAQEEKTAELAGRAKEAGLEEGASEEDVIAAETKVRAKAVGLEEDANLETIEKKELAKRAVAVGLAEDASKEDIEAKETKKPEPSEQEKVEAEALKKEQEEYDASVIKALMAPDKDGKKLAETEEQAREILEKDKAVIEKFGAEPYKLARGYRDLQGRANKAEEQIKHSQALIQQAAEQRVVEAKVDVPAVKKLIADGKISDGKGNALSEEQIVEACRAKHPELTESKEDAEVLDIAAEKIRDSYIKKQGDMKSERSTKASTRRRELVADLSEDDKEFAGEIEGVLKETSDAQILSPIFKLNDIIRWAKGGKYNKGSIETARKEGYDAGLKKGKEEAKALGERAPGAKNKPGKSSKPASGLSRELNSREEKRALEMYDGLADTNDKKKFQMYLDQFPNENDEFK